MPAPTCRVCGAPLAAKGDACVACARGSDATREAFSTTDAVIPVLTDEPGTRAAGSVDTGGAVAGKVTLSLRARTEFASVPGSSDPIVRVLVDATADGTPAFAAGEGPLAHLILLLDVSASMNHPDKYPILTDALRGMIEELAAPGAPPMLVSMAVFAEGAKTLFRDVPASELVARDVIALLDASPFRFGRYTDVAGALKRAGRIAVEQLHANRAMPLRVCLLTDGRPQDLERTRRVMARIAKLPIDVDALAFGGDAGVALLLELVSGGRGGTVKHVREDTLADAFGRVAEAARHVLSNRALFEFELGRGVVGSAAWRYRPGRHSFGGDAFEGAARFRTDLGTIESGRTYSLLFELRLPETRDAETHVGRISLRLRGDGGARSASIDVRIPRSGREPSAADPEVVAAADVLAAMAGNDVKMQLAALRVRRKLYAAERRDPHVRAIIDKAILALESEGTLAALTESECATLRSHTCTAGGIDGPELPGLARRR